MNVRTKLILAFLGSAAPSVLALAAPEPARPNGGLYSPPVESNVRVTLSQAAFCDGSVRTRLEPGVYDVHLLKNNDGSFRAVVNQGGIQKGETRAVGTPGSNQVLIGFLVPAVQVPAVQKPGALQVPLRSK